MILDLPPRLQRETERLRNQRETRFLRSLGFTEREWDLFDRRVAEIRARFDALRAVRPWGRYKPRRLSSWTGPG